MTEDAQILIARLLAHQTLRREDKLVKRALSDEIFRTELDDDDLTKISGELTPGRFALAVVYEDRSLATAAAAWAW